jgi:hypothetical protein
MMGDGGHVDIPIQSIVLKVWGQEKHVLDKGGL